MTITAPPIEAVASVGGAESDNQPLGSLLPYTCDAAKTLTDDQLIDAQRRVAEQRRLLDASAAVLAAEIDHRSRRELGHSGLAQRRGARSAEVLIQHVTGLSRWDARSLVRVGTIVTQQAPPARRRTTARRRLTRGAGAGGALARVRRRRRQRGRPVGGGGRGNPYRARRAERARRRRALADAAASLVREAREVTLERLAASARARRDELDEAGIALREEQRRERRYLHLIPQADGMTRISGLLDPESAAIVGGAIDAITAARRGGPRFVDPNEAARAKAIENDPRTTPQLALDGLVELIRVATLADRGRVLGAKRVGVRVHVAEADLRRGAGAARIEGQTDAVSIATAERIACDNGVLPIAIGFEGRPWTSTHSTHLHPSTTHRPRRQRRRMHHRDCERPPEWCEAHHIDEWMRDHGKTDLADGVLLCRQHHMMLHNLGYKIIREGSKYFLIPPEDSADRTPIPLRSNPPVRLRPTG